MRLFDKLRRELDYLIEADINKIQHAFQVAQKAHEGQFRQSGDPYITHPVAVAGILARIHMDAETIMASLLHDVIEDTPITKIQLSKAFGRPVAELVDGVSKLTQIEFKNRAEAQAENLRKMILAMSKDIRVIIVKLADRLHNMRTLEPLSPEKRRRIARETLDIFALIAYRLGMHDFAIELEDLGFKALYPNRYAILDKSLQRERATRKKIMNIISKNIRSALDKLGLKECKLIGREKHIYSIYKKMRRKDLSFDEIMDIYGFRIITERVDTCYQILGIIHRLYKPLPEKFKDYIAIPKANGYQSLHTILFGPGGVPIEIQIRTREMDIMANSGIAAHWLYKSEEALPNHSQIHAQQWVKNLLEMQKSTGSSLEFIENVKIDLFPDEVYMFTPKGKILSLPAGATPVDFAYMVHTDIGNTCVAAKIDRQLAPLSKQLISGQTVEIITSPKARPNTAWMSFVVTAKARASIRHYLKHQRREESIKLGKQLLKTALKAQGTSLRKISKENMENALQTLKLSNIESLLEAIGLGNQIPTLVARTLIIGAESKSLVAEERKTSPLIIKGTDGLVINLSDCCYPIPHDPIVGILSAGKGITIHHEHCHYVHKLRNKRKFIPVTWADKLEGVFKSAIFIEALNELGSLAKLTQIISISKVNIQDIQLGERQAQRFTITFVLEVKDRNQLAEVMRDLKQSKIVLRISRMR